MATESDNIVAETAARIFADLADPQTINNARDDAWKNKLWQALADAGLTLAWVPENLGGAGASLSDGFSIVAAAGRYALPVPLAETLLAGWLLAQAGIAAPTGAMTIAPVQPNEPLDVDADGALNGRVRAVPFARDAEHIAALVSGPKGLAVALAATADCQRGEGRNLAGEFSAAVTFARTRPRKLAPLPPSFDRHALLLMGATMRAMQIAGALETVLAMSVVYANERVAFERKIGKFQAVQQNLARLAGEAAAALAVSGSAADSIAHARAYDEGVLLEVASAKIRCAEAAAEGAAIAHQVFGAIGFTNEHILHRFTLRMLAWRDDFGNESSWAAKLGEDIARRGADEFWPLVASR
ncbi:MAG TPA: acyl-CoA dehydrogenase family protein [Pseudolabrys sp.]|nr:acyl-CoA dehydrogenase family protein [Pseudolabrys sp.]